MQREVNRNRGAAVEVGKYQLLEAQHTLVLHMVEHTADSLYRHTTLLKRRVIDDKASGLFCLLSMLLAENGEEADAHAEQQDAPVHRLTAHHAIIAVLSCLHQRVEVLAVHAEDALAVETEQA